MCCIVKKEATGFMLPEGSTTFLCPQAAPMGGFARTSPSYETSYTVDDVTGKTVGEMVILFLACSRMKIKVGS